MLRESVELPSLDVFRKHIDVAVTDMVYWANTGGRWTAGLDGLGGARLCKDGVKKAKAQLELYLSRGANKNMKSFYRYIKQ